MTRPAEIWRKFKEGGIKALTPEELEVLRKMVRGIEKARTVNIGRRKKSRRWKHGS